MVARFSCLLLRFSWEKCLFLTLQYYCFFGKTHLRTDQEMLKTFLWNPQSVLNNPQKTSDMFGSSWHSQDENDKSYMYIWDCDKLGQRSYCISTWILSQCVVNNQKCSRFCKLLLFSYCSSGAGIVCIVCIVCFSAPSKGFKWAHMRDASVYLTLNTA